VASPNAVDYAITNATWPVGVALPALDDIEALRVARYLLRVFVGWPRRGQPYSARISHGNRHTWIRGNVLTVNPSKGWKDLVHGLSHVAWQLSEPHARAHNEFHATLEREMIAYVIEQGWLDGRLRPPIPLPASPEEKRKQKLDHARAMLHRAETRLRRSTTIAKKWRARVARLERQEVRDA
jgi:hypothetical protein